MAAAGATTKIATRSVTAELTKLWPDTLVLLCIHVLLTDIVFVFQCVTVGVFLVVWTVLKTRDAVEHEVEHIEHELKEAA